MQLSVARSTWPPAPRCSWSSARCPTASAGARWCSGSIAAVHRCHRGLRCWRTSVHRVPGVPRGAGGRSSPAWCCQPRHRCATSGLGRPRPPAMIGYVTMGMAHGAHAQPRAGRRPAWTSVFGWQASFVLLMIAGACSVLALVWADQGETAQRPASQLWPPRCASTPNCCAAPRFWGYCHHGHLLLPAPSSPTWAVHPTSEAEVYRPVAGGTGDLSFGAPVDRLRGWATTCRDAMPCAWASTAW
jgi:hypothetical protein